jgi:ADP-ribosyl-[dinitrogen reductase] hydrolase
MRDNPGHFRGCLLGLAAGDAVGTTVEFRERGSFTPLTDMVGGGPFHLKPGQWTDDTSMALCLAASLVERRGFDARDQMERYCRWKDEGYLSSTGRCFDIGGTTRASLEKFQRTGEPFSGSTDTVNAGNGSLMRLAAAPLYYFPDIDACECYSGESSRTTHGTKECVDACRLFGRMLCRALAGSSKDEIAFADRGRFTGAAKVVAIAGGIYTQKTRDEIQGSGYVIGCLEAALWCFLNTDSYREAILLAANLGDDADTTAAVCGQLAGAYYGATQIPAGWLERLSLRAEITTLADRLLSKE